MTNNGPFKNELNSAQITFLDNAKNNYKGRAALQASNILCFYAGICEEDKDLLNLSAIGRSQIATENTFFIRGNADSEIRKVELFNLMGQQIEVELSTLSKEEVTIDLKENKKGIYLLKITNQSGISETNRLIKN